MFSLDYHKKGASMEKKNSISEPAEYSTTKSNTKCGKLYFHQQNVFALLDTSKVSSNHPENAVYSV